MSIPCPKGFLSPLEPRWIKLATNLFMSKDDFMGQHIFPYWIPVVAWCLDLCVSLESWLRVLAPAILYGSDPQTALAWSFGMHRGWAGGLAVSLPRLTPVASGRAFFLSHHAPLKRRRAGRIRPAEQLRKGGEGRGLQARGWRRRWRWHWPHGRVDRRVRAARWGREVRTPPDLVESSTP